MVKDVFMTKEFNEKYYYEKNDLGFHYSQEATSFRVWAPFAQSMTLRVYETGDASDTENAKEYEMYNDIKGTWCIAVEGDLHGVFYTYKVRNQGQQVTEVADPYAKAAGVNGKRSAVVDLSRTNPENWQQDKKPFFKHATDCVIYELHIRDLSSSKDSGIYNVGKFLEFTENVANGEEGITRGINHIKELGATHVHLLPVFDFATVDESIANNDDFNWGYDPENYNVPEGSYSTDAYKPDVRIKEFKEMVMALHENGLRVIMDVVYNHTLENINSKFHILVPGYYYRMNTDGTFKNGSFCNSETASERLMMRKYIVDSVKYWAQEYHVDGFRFDLMGLHDVDTMNEVKSELSKMDQSIIVYGEGWDMGNLPKKERAIQKHAHRMPGIGFFNDHIRDSLKGPWSNVKRHGFVDGRKGFEQKVMKGVCGSIPYNAVLCDYNAEPGQSINYVEAHDNNTLWDKLLIANSNVKENTLIKMDMLANAIILTSQGIPFLSSGMEFLRTKHGDENSFKSPDSINMLDWSRKVKYRHVFNYCRDLIKLRKEHPAFRMTTTSMIKEHLNFIEAPKNTVAYILKDNANSDSWRNILVVYNANKTSQTIIIPEAEWTIVVKDNKAGTDEIDILNGNKLEISPISTIVMYTKDDIIIKDLFQQ